MDVPRAGARLGGRDTRHEAEVTLGKSICSQRRSVSIFGSFFFVPRQRVKLIEQLSPDGSLDPLSFCQRSSDRSWPKQTNKQTTVITRECSINDCGHTVINDNIYRHDAANQHSRVGIPHKSQTHMRSSNVNCLMLGYFGHTGGAVVGFLLLLYF